MTISIFQFQTEQSVRVEFQNSEPFFCLKDVAEILEIKDAKSKNFNLSAKGVENFPTPTKGGIQKITFINEPNLYRVIFRSNKPEAVKFQDWIFEEVIPQIRKTGSYTNQQYDPRITPAQKQTIRNAVKARVYRTGETFQSVYEKLHDLFYVNSYHEIQAADFQTALDFLGSIPNTPAKPKEKSEAPYQAEYIDGRLVKYRTTVNISQFDEEDDIYMLTVKQGRITEMKSFRPTGAVLTR